MHFTEWIKSNVLEVYSKWHRLKYITIGNSLVLNWLADPVEIFQFTVYIWQGFNIQTAGYFVFKIQFLFSNIVPLEL